jgi:GT2 family glycosyltransferase
MKLSVIIVSYNAIQVLKQCVALLEKRLQENFKSTESEIIVVDNNSTSGNQNWLQKQKKLKSVFLKENIGFGQANNIGLKLAKGQYILFLNSDVYIKEKINFVQLIDFLASDQKKAGLTIKLVLPDGKIDPASHRGFPTPWNAFTYFSQLEKLTKKTALAKFFGGYHLTQCNLNTIHKIDSPTAAFYLLKKNILDKLKGFDPDYFFYGEDLDLSYRIKQLSYSIWYYPKYTALHLKYQSGKKSLNQADRTKAKRLFYETMLIFYEKHYKTRYPRFVNYLVKSGVKAIKLVDSYKLREKRRTKS